MKTSLHLKYRAGKKRSYWVSAFTGNLLEAGFEATILHEFSCIITELHDFDKAKNLKCFSLIVPEDKYRPFIAWLRKVVDLDLVH